MNLKDLNKFDSDRLDGKHASNSANNVPVLDSNAKIPLDQIPTGTTKTTVALGKHIHDDMYYTEREIDDMMLINNDGINKNINDSISDSKAEVLDSVSKTYVTSKDYNTFKGNTESKFNTVSSKLTLLEEADTAINTNLSNNYYKKTDVDNAVNDVRFDFKHQGTANLQYNGNGGYANHDGWFAYHTWWYDNANGGVPGYVVSDGEESGCAQAPYIRANENTKYSVKVHVCPEVNTGNFWVAIKQLKSSDLNFFSYKTIWGDDTQKGWHTVRATFTTDPGIDGFQVELWNGSRKSTSASYVTFFSELMVLPGADYFPDYYVPYIGGIFGNTTTIDDQGITVYMDNASNQNARSVLNHDGLTIYGGSGAKKVWFGDNDSAFIDRITCNKIEEPTLIKNNMNSPVNLYCAPNASGDGTGRSPENRASSISNALEWLRSTYGCYTYKRDINIWLANGDYWGAENYIGGWIGSGCIWINFDQWACLRTPVQIEDNTMTVGLIGTVSPWDYNTQNNAYIYLGDANAIVVRNSKVILGGLNIQKEGWGGQKGTWDNYQASCICAEKGARVLATACDIVGFWNTVYAKDMSVVTINDCRGHCHTRGDIDSGSILIRNLGYPICADSTFYHGGGSAIGSHDKENNSFFAPKPDAPYTPPPAPTENWQWTENTFWATRLWTTLESPGSGGSTRNDCWGQGKYSSYKCHRGHATFDGVHAWCNGGRNFSAYITMHRLNTSHGSAGAVPVPKFVQTDGNSWSCGQAFARDDTKTIQLPWEVTASLIQGSTNELQLWAGNSTSDYSFYDNVSIRIVCEKNFV